MNFPTFSVFVSDFVLQKLLKDILENWNKNSSSTELFDKSSLLLINKPNRKFRFALPISEIVDNNNNNTQQSFNIIEVDDNNNTQQSSGETIIKDNNDTHQFSSEMIIEDNNDTQQSS
ncbi:17803_t:CDS:2, partial [Dentiscutata erythropus]